MTRLRMTSCRFIIDLHPYNRQLYVSVGETDERFDQGLCRLFKDDELLNSWRAAMSPFYPHTDGRTAHIAGSGIVLRLRDFPTHNQHFATIAHEVFHTVEFLFWGINLPHNAEVSSEAWAYMIGHIYHQILQNLFPPND